MATVPRKVLAQHGPALLLERATGPRSLAAMVADRPGRRGEPHSLRRGRAPACAAPGPPPELVPLARWFEALAPAARTHGGLLAQADSAAQALLADPRDVVVLHGDIHHGNVLDGGERGWLAIDPKGLLGERTFDFVNILRNPDAAAALAPGRFDRQVGGAGRCRIARAAAPPRLDAGVRRPVGGMASGRRYAGRSRLRGRRPRVTSHNDKRRKPCVASPFPANVPSRP